MIIIAAVFWGLVALVLQAAGALGPLLGAVALICVLYHGWRILLTAGAGFLGVVIDFLERAGGRAD
ncbi:MAG: hypothetical protein ISN28_14815 [Ectothiorhodospiraceae bacterium AqS1]|nr:hypothetical protein [Ectothiorhodospiraceae bacterium AqS1]